MRIEVRTKRHGSESIQATSVGRVKEDDGSFWLVLKHADKKTTTRFNFKEIVYWRTIE